MIRASTGARCLAAAWVMFIACTLSACGDDSSESISGTPATMVVVGQPYRFAPNVEANPDGPLSFTIANKPAWASFDPATGQLSGTPTASQIGVTRAIQISVTGPLLRASLSPFSITVTPATDSTTAASIILSWQAPTDNSDGSALTNLGGYKIYYGEASGEYSSSIRVSNPSVTTYVV
ncbi:MAG: putative Ig domain-containing protein [Terriglobales bacterium]